MVTRAKLIDWVRDARQRTFELVADLSDDQLIGPPLPTLNPLLWEIGHVAWFQEKWVLRYVARHDPIRADADALYDSSAVAHDTRWDLRLPSREETLRYMREVRDQVLERLGQREPSPVDVYFTLLSIFHEDMHTEAFTYTRQTLGYRAPALEQFADVRSDNRLGCRLLDSDNRAGCRYEPEPGALRGEGRVRGWPDAEIPGGTFQLGAPLDKHFVFDNEKWAHPVEIRPFAIARVPVTQAEFADFVEDGGYRQARFWNEQGWHWREEKGAEHPVYWRREAAGRWLRRDFDQWVPLEARRPMLHVNWYEADAYSRWAGRRLPSESEWEVAAAGEPDLSGRGLGRSKRRFPWGGAFPTPERAHLDWRTKGCVDVDALPEGDSAFGCRQMIGNVWEWTADDFLPYPGFVADPYKEYSAPWFGSHKVLRGGCWATRSRLIRNTWRNFYLPDRRDVWAGFRTCALKP
jgi:iron(II)-dependent oxidoreductase